MKTINKLILAPLALLLPSISLAHSGDHHSGFLFNLLHPLLGPEYSFVLSHPLILLAMASAAIGIFWSIKS